MKNIPVLLVLLALLAVGLLVFLELRGPTQTDIREEERKKAQTELRIKLDSMHSAHIAIKIERDSLLTLDSLNQIKQENNRKELEALKKKLKVIPGKYKDIPRDSLAIIMDQRADNARQTH